MERRGGHRHATPGAPRGRRFVTSSRWCSTNQKLGPYCMLPRASTLKAGPRRRRRPNLHIGPKRARPRPPGEANSQGPRQTPTNNLRLGCVPFTCPKMYDLDSEKYDQYLDSDIRPLRGAYSHVRLNGSRTADFAASDLHGHGVPGRDDKALVELPWLSNLAGGPGLFATRSCWL